MKKTTCSAFALALWLLVLQLAPAGAAPRCFPTERFKVLSDQLSVRDTLTKLVWQRQASTTGMSWAEAKTYCANAGGGFRLPTVKELRSLVDFAVAVPGPTIDSNAFPNTPAKYFWTSSPYAGGTAWIVDFLRGSSSGYAVGDNNWARCVR